MYVGVGCFSVATLGSFALISKAVGIEAGLRPLLAAATKHIAEHSPPTHISELLSEEDDFAVCKAMHGAFMGL